MSYINKGLRVFKYQGGIREPTHVRSEARIKEYASSYDLRSWSDVVEQRRQHILEHAAKNLGGKAQFCIENLIPLDVLFDILMTNKEEQADDLEKEIEYLEKSLDLYNQIGLTSEQKAQIEQMIKENGLMDTDSELD